MNLFFLSAVTSPSRPNSSTILSWFPHLKCVSSTSESPTFEGTWNGNIYYTRWIKNSPTSASRVTQSTMRFFRTRRTFPRVNFFSFSPFLSLWSSQLFIITTIILYAWVYHHFCHVWLWFGRTHAPRSLYALFRLLTAPLLTAAVRIGMMIVIQLQSANTVSTLILWGEA